MERIKSIIITSFLVFLIPFAIVAGQDKKNEQRIKIVIAEDDGSKVILDTLISGTPGNDSIILDNGKTLYLLKEDNDDTGGHYSKKYFITSTSPDGSDSKKEVKKEITIISSDSDSLNDSGDDESNSVKCESLSSGKKYAFIVESDNKNSESEKTKYIISRDGVVITVEGSDYTKVKEIIKDIEKALDSKNHKN